MLLQTTSVVTTHVTNISTHRSSSLSVPPLGEWRDELEGETLTSPSVIKVVRMTDVTVEVVVEVVDVVTVEVAVVERAESVVTMPG